MDWEAFSCATFIGGAVLAQTGWDPTALNADIYKTPTEAAQVILDAGFETFAEYVGSVFPEVPVIMGQQGDIAAMPLDPVIARAMPPEIQCALGVVDPPLVWVLAGKGLFKLPMMSALHMFRVGV